jgi:uncharacterized protein
MDPVRMVFTKWGDRAHWEFDALLLGHDEHGSWLGAPAGTWCTRPGASYCAEQHYVVLVPDDGWFVASFYDPGGPPPQGMVDVYVDIATPAAWATDRVTVTDLDLDVLRGRSGRTWVDDEDEFAAARRGYPDDVVRQALSTCADTLEAVRYRRPPYDAVVSEHWLDRLRTAMMDR